MPSSKEGVVTESEAASLIDCTAWNQYGGNREQSEAISGNQWQSVAIKCNHLHRVEPVRGHVEGVAGLEHGEAAQCSEL